MIPNVSSEDPSFYVDHGLDRSASSADFQAFTYFKSSSGYEPPRQVPKQDERKIGSGGTFGDSSSVNTSMNGYSHPSRSALVHILRSYFLTSFVVRSFVRSFVLSFFRSFVCLFVLNAFSKCLNFHCFESIEILIHSSERPSSVSDVEHSTDPELHESINVFHMGSSSVESGSVGAYGSHEGDHKENLAERQPAAGGTGLMGWATGFTTMISDYTKPLLPR
jgi:hypothetical protein